MKQLKKVLAMILCLAMCLSMFPASAFAEEGAAEAPAEQAGEPVYEEPVYEEPVYEEPVYEEPVYEEPAYEEPAYEEPVYEEPAYEEPVSEEPAYEEPVYEEPVNEEPAYEEPVYEEPVNEEPVNQEPATAEPETPQPVRVIFEVPAEGAAVRVYTKDENLNETDVAAEEDGSFLLLPGQYYYRVNAEGYTETEETEFTIEASEETFTVAVEMTLSGTGSDADSAEAALTVAEILTGTGVSYYTPENDGTTNEELLTEYAAQQLEKAKRTGGGMLMAPGRPTSGLNPAQTEAYYKLKDFITETAAGSKPLTQYAVNFDSDFISENLTWTPETLPGGGYESFTEENWQAAAEQGYEATMALGPLHTALLNTLPFELYWYDKTMGVMCSYSFSASKMSDGSIGSVSITSITYIFTVAEAYSDGQTYAKDSSGNAIRNPNNGRAYPIRVKDVGSTINAAVANAQAVVSSNSGRGDAEKLAAYKDYICAQVSYNHEAAADDYNLGYGDPWQLIYAFDNDANTDIVCEGYSKAFEYLCDLSSFSSNVHAYCVTGTMDGGTGAGAHMWNIVSMDDGRNYLVDVTNCDEGSVGAPDQLFLKGCASGNADEGYIFSCNDGASQIAYLYDSNTRNYYNTDELTVSAYDYGEAAPIEALQAACDAGENYILTESLTIPAELNLNVNQGTVITVPENMTLTVNGKLTFEGQSGLVVEQGGLAEIGNGGSIGINSRPDLTRISGTLSVGNGRLYVSRGVWENQSGGIYSANITAGEYGQIHIEGTVFTADGAGETMSRLEATTIPEGLRAAVRLDFNIMFAWTLEDSYILPEGINVCVKNSGGNENGSLTVSEGSRLTVPEGGALILEGAALEVNGELVNDGEIELRANRTGAASLTLNQGAAWGNGEIRVRTAEDPQNWLQGFDPDELILVSSSDSETVYRFAVALTDNISFETAIELTEDQLFDVTGSAEGVTRYYKFTPAESSYYGLKMNGDSVLWVQMVDVFGADRSYVGSGDQYSGPYVYQLPYLTAGETYYIVIQIGNEGTASFELCWDNHLRAYPADDAWETLVPYGESAVLRVTADGADLSNLSYEWRDGEGNTIAGETADTLTTAAITGRTTYYCVVTDQFGNTASAHFEVGIDNALTATAADGITELKLPMGAAFTLSVNVTALNPEGMTYRWTKWGDGVEYTELTETGTSLTDTVSGRLYYQFMVQDQYENHNYVMFQISVDNQLQAWVEGTDGSGSQNFYLKPGETATMKAAVSAAQSENMSYRWNWEVYYTNGRVETDSMSGSLQMTSIQMPEAVDYVHYIFQVQDTYHNYASVHYWLKPFTYSCGVNGDNVTWSFDESTGVLTFSGTGDMAGSVGAWEMYKDRITAVVFTDGVTGVGADTFSSFTGITSVSLPEGVRSIAYSGFEGCTGLTDVTLPNSLEEIGNTSFARSGLTSITIPDNVRTIEYSSFEGCSSLSAVNLPANLEEIGERAFADNTSLTEITIPVTTARILPYAFSGCVNLQTVNYPGTQEQWDAIEIGEGNDPLLYAQLILGGQTDPTTDALPAPTHVIWNQNWIGAPGDGMAHFEYESETKLDVVVSFYRVGEEQQAIYEGDEWAVMNEQPEGSGKWLCHSAWFKFNSRELENGSYFFTVKLVAGDEESVAVRSESWTYTAPSVSVPSPEVNGIVYTAEKELVPDFTLVGSDYAQGPQFTVEYRPDVNSEEGSRQEKFSYRPDLDPVDEAKKSMNETMHSEGYGEGWYRIGVMVNSSDITAAKNSETVYSEWQFISAGQIAGTEESGPLGALRAAIARGDSSFTLRDNLTIPAAEGVYGDNIALIISDGTTLTLEGALTVGTLTVNGEIIVIGSDMNTALAVRSNLAFGENGTLRVPSPGPFIELNGGSNSRNYSNYFSGIVPHLDLADGASVIFGYGVNSESDIRSVLSDLYNNGILNDGRFRQDLQLQTNVTLSGDLYLPTNASLHTDCVWNSDTLTVAEGASLTLENGSWLYAFSSDTVVEGSLYNDGEIILGVQVDTGTVSSLILSGGSYEGNGEIRVQTAENPMNYLQGFNPDELVVVRSSGSETVYRVAGEAAEENSVELVRIETDEYGNVTATLRVSTTAELADSWYTYGVQISNRPDFVWMENAYNSTFGGMAMNARYNGKEVDFGVWSGELVPGATYYVKAILQNGSYNEEYGYFEYTDIVAEGETVLSFTAPGSDADFTPIELGDSATVHQYETGKFLFTAPADGLYALTGSVNYIGAFGADGGAKNNPVWMDGQNPANSMVFYAAAEEKVYLFASANFGDGAVQLVNADQVMSALVLNSATPVDSGTTVRFTAAEAGYYKITYSPVTTRYGIQLMDKASGTWTYYSPGPTVKLAAGESAYFRANYDQSQGQRSVIVTKITPPTKDSVSVAAATNVTNSSATFTVTYSVTEATAQNGYRVGILTSPDDRFTQPGWSTWLSSDCIANGETISNVWNTLYPGESFYYRAVIIDRDTGREILRGDNVYKLTTKSDLNGYTKLTKGMKVTLGANVPSLFYYDATEDGMLAIDAQNVSAINYTIPQGTRDGQGDKVTHSHLMGAWAKAGKRIYISAFPYNNGSGLASTVEITDGLATLPVLQAGQTVTVGCGGAVSFTAEKTGLYHFEQINPYGMFDFRYVDTNGTPQREPSTNVSMELNAGDRIWIWAGAGSGGRGDIQISAEYVDPNVTLENLKTAIANGETYFDLGGLLHLTLTEDLTIPENMHVDFWGTQLQVPAGVKLTVLGSMRGEFTEIGGTVEVRGGDLYQKGILFTNDDAMLDLNSMGGASIPVDSWAAADGHVNFGADCYLNLNDEAYSVPELEAAKARIAEPREHVTHWISVNFPLTLSTGDYETIPQNAVYEFANNCMLFVDQKATLNVLGGLKLRGTAAEIGGKINNEGWIEVAADDSGTMGMVHLKDGGSYTGAGELRVMTTTEPQTWLHGFDPDSLKEKWSDATWVCYVYTMGIFDALETACNSGEGYWLDVPALTIARDLTIPANMHVDAWNTVITVPEGVTLTVNGSIGVKGVIVEDGGTLRFGDESYGNITESLVYSDTDALSLGRNVNLNVDVTAWNQMTSHAAIGFADETSKIKLYSAASSDEELENVLEELTSGTLPEGQETHFGKFINILYDWTPSNEFSIDAGTSWNISGIDGGSITVAQGNTLMIGGNLCLYGAEMNVNGKLYNNGSIDLQTDFGGAKSVLNLGPDGEYEGDGIVQISHGDPESELFGFTDYTLATLWEDEESVGYRIVEGLVQEDVIFSEDTWDITATSAQLRVGLSVTEETANAGEYVWGILYTTDPSIPEDEWLLWGWNVDRTAYGLKFINHDLCTLVPDTAYYYKAILFRPAETGNIGTILAKEEEVHEFSTASADDGEIPMIAEGDRVSLTPYTHSAFSFEAAPYVYYTVSGRNLDYISVKDTSGNAIPFFYSPSALSGEESTYAIFAVNGSQIDSETGKMTVYIWTGNHDSGNASSYITVDRTAKTATALSADNPVALTAKRQAVKFTAPVAGWYEIAVTGSEAFLAMVDFGNGTWYSPGTARNIYLSKGDIWIAVAGGVGASVKVTRAGSDLAENLAYLGTRDINYYFNLNEATVITDAVTVPRNVRLNINAEVIVEDTGVLTNYGDIYVEDGGSLTLSNGGSLVMVDGSDGWYATVSLEGGSLDVTGGTVTYGDRSMMVISGGYFDRLVEEGAYPNSWTAGLSNMQGVDPERIQFELPIHSEADFYACLNKLSTCGQVNVLLVEGMELNLAGEVPENFCLVINEGCSVTVPGGDEAMVYGGFALEGGSLINNGTLNLNGYVNYQLSSSRFENNGTLNVSGWIGVNSWHEGNTTGTLYNSGTISLTGGTIEPEITVIGSEPQTIECIAIDEENFPDENFRNYVGSTIDSNGDGQLSDEEIEAVTEIHVDGMEIGSLRGIELFTGLEVLSASGNDLTELDLSANTKLTELDVSSNRLASLNLSNCPNLSTLNATDNSLTRLDLRSCPGVSVSCDDTVRLITEAATEIEITEANFPDAVFRDFIKGFNTDGSMKDVEEYGLYGDSITRSVETLDSNEIAAVEEGIDVSGMGIASLQGIELFTGLRSLKAANNNLTGLDLSGNADLVILDVSGNRLTTLNISGCPALLDVVQKGTMLSQDGITRNWFETADGKRELKRDTSARLITGKGVEISMANFPDANFRAYVAKHFDLNGTGTLDADEIANVTGISLWDENYEPVPVSNLQGIEFFPALTNLWVENNNITSLDLKANQRLENLTCKYNLNLTSVDLSQNTALRTLFIEDNKLSKLDVSANVNLESLHCGNNPLTVLDLSHNPALTNLEVYGTRLSKLDVSKNEHLSTILAFDTPLTSFTPSTGLRILSLNNARLTSLDVSGCPNLIDLSVRQNRLTSLSLNSSLAALDCSGNQLSNLDLGANANLYVLRCSGNRLKTLDISGCSSLKAAIADSGRRVSLSSGVVSISVNADGNETLVMQYDNTMKLNLGEEELSGFCGASGNGSNLTWTLEPNGTLNISGSGAMKNFASAEETPWALNAGSITNVLIGNAVTTIGSYAFAGCENLHDVFLTGNKPTIAANAFENLGANFAEGTRIHFPGRLNYQGIMMMDTAYGAAKISWTPDDSFKVLLDPNGGAFEELDKTLAWDEENESYEEWQERAWAWSSANNYWRYDSGFVTRSKIFNEYGVIIPMSVQPTREGYVFQGWSQTATGGVRYKAGDAFNENVDRTLYAVWKANTYQINFNSNIDAINESRELNGEEAVTITGTMRAQNMNFGKAQTLTQNAYRYAGNSFVGWALTPKRALDGMVDFVNRENVTDEILIQKVRECTESPMEGEESFDFYNGGADLFTGGEITLYAVWKATAVSVTLYSGYEIADDNSLIPASVPVPIIEGSTLTVDMYEMPTIELQAEVNPYDGNLATSAEQSVRWTTSSAAIATVDENGVVSFQKPGTVTITATTTDGTNKRATVKFSIYYIDPGNRLTASLAETSTTYAVATSIGLQKGDTAQLNIYGTDTTTPLPQDLFQYDITTRDGDQYLKFESNGQVTALQGGNKSISIKVSLLNDPLKRTVNVNIKTIAPQTKVIDMTNANVTLEDGAIYLEKKTTAQTITITPIVKDAAGQEIPLKRGLLTYASTNRAAAAPTETSSGAVTVTIPANATGAATIMATSKDYAKTVGSLSIYVMDYEPRTDVKSVTIDSHMGTTAEIPLVVSNGNEITKVVFKEYIAASRSYEPSVRIEAELNTEDDPTTAKVKLRANTGIANSTIKGQLEVETKRYDKNGNTVVNTYTYDLNVVSKSTLPSISIRQTPFNTFYKDSESTVTVTVRNTQVEWVELNAGTIFRSEGFYTDGENTVLTIRFDDTQEIFPTNGSTNAFNPTAAQKNGTLSIKLQGYVNPVQQPISIQTNNVRPALKLSAASTSLNTALDGNTATTTLVDNRTNEPYDLVISDPATQLTVGDRTPLAAVRNVGPTFMVVLNTRNARGELQGGRVTMNVQDDNWTQAISYPFNVTVNTQLPRLTPAQGTLTLNKRFPEIGAATKVSSNQGGTDLGAVQFGKPEVKPAAAEGIIEAYYDQGNRVIVVGFEESGSPETLANSTYTFTFHPTYKGTPLPDVSVRVNVNDQQPTATLTPNSVSLSAFCTGGEQQTVIKLNNDLVSVDDVEAILTTRNVPDLFNIECVGDNNLIVSYKPGVEIYTYEESNNTVVRYNETEIPARATSYTYQLTPILSEGENQTARPVNLTIRTIDDRPTLRAAKTSFTLNSAFGTADSTAISLVNVPGQTIIALDWAPNNTAAKAGFDKLSFEESFAADGGASGLTIRIAETDKTTYSVPVRLVALVQREDGATIESKPMVINVRAVNTMPNVTLATPTLTINRKLAVPAISTIKVPAGYDFVGFTEMEETGVYGDGNAILTLSKGRLQARLTQSAIDANRNGSYRFNLTPIVMDINTGITAECRTLTATVSNTSSDTWRINVAPSGKLDTVQRFSDEGKMIYTITGMNGIQGIPTSASLENVGDGRYASLFNVSGVQINDRGQAYVVLSLKAGVDYPTNVNYNKLKLRFTFADGTGEGIQVDSQEISLRVTQTALRLTAKENKQTVYQSQAKTRTVTYEIELTSPNEATMNDLNVTVGDIRQWQSALENPDEDIFFELKENSYGRTLLVHVTLKDLAQLAAGRTYTLPILVKAEGAASNMAATTVNLNLAVQK